MGADSNSTGDMGINMALAAMDIGGALLNYGIGREAQ